MNKEWLLLWEKIINQILTDPEKEKEQKGDDTEFLREVYQLVIGDEHASRTDENKFSHEEVLSLIGDYQQAYYAQELK